MSREDSTYDAYVTASLFSSELSEFTYKMFLTPDENNNMVTLVHCATGHASHFCVPPDFDLTPNNKAKLTTTVPKQKTLKRCYEQMK